MVLHACVDADAPGDLEVRAYRADAVLIVEVADDGRGMVSRIDGPGLGLGLPLIAQMADVIEIRTQRERRGLVLRMRFNLTARRRRTDEERDMSAQLAGRRATCCRPAFSRPSAEDSVRYGEECERAPL